MMEPVTKENVLDSTAADALLPVKQKEEFVRIESILLEVKVTEQEVDNRMIRNKPLALVEDLQEWKLKLSFWYKS